MEKNGKKRNWKNTSDGSKQFCQTIKDIRFFFSFIFFPERSILDKNVNYFTLRLEISRVYVCRHI